jgi:GDP-4-dehydro-6-deoxy-D-mannose reductase
MKVFITGIEGFVGIHLARLLHDQGHSVSGFFYVAPVSDLSFARIQYCDIRNPGQLHEQLVASAPDSIVHLAGISSVAIAEQDFAGTLAVNVQGSMHLLEANRSLPTPARVLLVSSSEVYGRSAGSSERLSETSPCRPQNNYAFSKYVAEATGHYYADRYGLDIVTLRPFSHTGPGQSSNFVFPSVARQIAEAEAGRRPPEIEVGNLDVSRDYSDVRDICQAYSLALTRAEPGQTYNVTSEQVLRIGEGIDYLVAQARVPIAVKVSPARKRQENPLLAGSSAKFRSATGWRPEQSIRQTLTDLLEYQRVLVRDLG